VPLVAADGGEFLPVEIPEVLSFTPKSGTVSGLTAVSVTGAGFLAGMTSTLGMVSNITATTCTITTESVESPGPVSWTLTNVGGEASESQVFTFT
jgi:hypothetical protein